MNEDIVEAKAIQETLGDVPVTASKSYFGNLGPSSGAVELVAAVQALVTDTVPPTLNYNTPDPNCPINVVAGSPLNGAKPTALALNQATTGQAVAVAISR